MKKEMWSEDGQELAKRDTSNGAEKYSARAPDDFADHDKLDSVYNLPVTADRTAKWYYSAFHNVTAMVGAGVLGLPYAFKYLLWPGGIVTIVLSYVISLYTLWQLCILHEDRGKRFNRYHELGSHAFGQRRGWWIITIPQLVVMVGLGITYTVTGGRSMHYVWQQLACCDTCTQCRPFGLSAWIIVFAAAQLILIQCPNFNSLTVVSLSAAIMSLAYSTIAFGASMDAGLHYTDRSKIDYTLNREPAFSGVFGVFNALGTVAFAYGGHNVVLEIQATLPHPPSTVKPMMKGVYVAYVVVLWCYFSVSIAGYWAFGYDVQDNILQTVGKPKWLIVMANLMVVVHVIGSFQVYTMPVLDMIEHGFAKRGINLTTLPARLLYRSAYVVLISFVACTIPFFGSLMGFIGAFGTGPTTFWLPAVIYLVLRKPGVGNIHFWASWICIILGVAVTILGSIGGLVDIIESASTYKFYQ
ncbi:hypothetical protein WJX81_002553 [Elliptochloris bilobata]|uniref:Amino acid transporter transmembrane domain-containing protein n=1 Tax=Elliptochloris bilobata TaxID=381761 RepID=A0AAW1QZR4_9CHLO